MNFYNSDINLLKQNNNFFILWFIEFLIAIFIRPRLFTSKYVIIDEWCLMKVFVANTSISVGAICTKIALLICKCSAKINQLLIKIKDNIQWRQKPAISDFLWHQQRVLFDTKLMQYCWNSEKIFADVSVVAIETRLLKTQL